MSEIQVKDLAGIADVTTKITDKWFERKDRLAERDKLAQEKVSLALSETTMYLGEFRKGKTDREQEKALSKLWREASVALSEVDEGLAKSCFLKMEYWADPERWSTEDIERTKIRLEQVSERIRQTMFKDSSDDNW
jgi:hypothetical protein